MNGVPWEVPRPKPEGRRPPRVFGRGTPFTMIHARLFHTFSFLCHPGLVKRDLFQPMESLGTPLENGEGMKPSPSIELNHNMLVRDVERMKTVVLGMTPPLPTFTV